MRYTANSKIQKNCSFFFIEANQFLIIACTERLSHRGEINRLNYIRFSCTVFPVRTVMFPTGSIEKSSKFRISMRWAFPHLISSPQLFYRLLHQEIIHLRYGFFSFFLNNNSIYKNFILFNKISCLATGRNHIFFF